jgi:hypothetical protein
MVEEKDVQRCTKGDRIQKVPSLDLNVPRTVVLAILFCSLPMTTTLVSIAS